MKKNQLLFTVFILFLLILGVGCNKTDTKSSHSDTATDSISNSNPELIENEKKQNTAAEIYAKKQVPVLCYHRIENGRNDEYTVTPATFNAHLQILADSGYHTINPDELYNYLVFNHELPEKPVMITFDDSRVEHATIAAPQLEKFGFRGVFFIMTITYNKKNYMSTEQLSALSKAGHTVGFHSWDHTRATWYTNDSVVRVNIVEPKKKLEEIIGKPVEYFAYPYGLTDARTTKQMDDYFKISFILSTKQDSIYPLQSVRRMIAPEWKPQSLLRAMNKTFSRN